MRMDKIICKVPNEDHERQIKETMDALSKGLEGFYGTRAERGLSRISSFPEERNLQFLTP